VYLYGNLSRNLSVNTTDGEFGAHIDLTLQPLLLDRLRDENWKKDRYLWTRFGYVWLHSADGRDPGYDERRGVIEVTGRVPLPGQVWLVNRERVDLRNINGAFSQRYRFKLVLEREFIVCGVVTVPFAEAETSFDTRYDAWSQQFYKGGAEIILTKHWRLEANYLWQVNRYSSPARLDALGIILKMFL
jgi:hypothetical protein